MSSIKSALGRFQVELGIAHWSGKGFNYINAPHIKIPDSKQCVMVNFNKSGVAAFGFDRNGNYLGKYVMSETPEVGYLLLEPKLKPIDSLRVTIKGMAMAQAHKHGFNSVQAKDIYDSIIDGLGEDGINLELIKKIANILDNYGYGT